MFHILRLSASQHSGYQLKLSDRGAEIIMAGVTTYLVCDRYDSTNRFSISQLSWTGDTEKIFSSFLQDVRHFRGENLEVMLL